MTENNRSSKRQRELLNFVDTFIQGHGYGPSYREIMRALGYKSVSTVAIHIDGLMSKGYLRKRDRSARSLEVVTMNIVDESAAVIRVRPTPAQEKWLVGSINRKFDDFMEDKTPEKLDELYVLVGALKILGLEGVHIAMKSRLMDLLKIDKKTE